MPGIADEVELTCKEARNEWVKAYELLVTCAEELRLAKEESIGPKVQERMEDKSPKVPTARVVRSVLDERRQQIAEAVKKTDKARTQEAYSFEKWRNCARRGRARSRDGFRSNPDVLERKEFRQRLKKLMVDEAYAQYKDYRPRTPSDYYYGASRYPEPRGQGYGSQWGRGYQGYYR
jgi:hypothetical protein